MYIVIEGIGNQRRIISVGVNPYVLQPGQEQREIQIWDGWHKSEVHWDELLQAVIPEPYPPSPEELAELEKQQVLAENMILIKFAKMVLLDLNAIRAGQPRPEAVIDFINKVKDYL